MTYCFFENCRVARAKIARETYHRTYDATTEYRRKKWRKVERFATKLCAYRVACADWVATGTIWEKKSASKKIALEAS